MHHLKNQQKLNKFPTDFISFNMLLTNNDIPKNCVSFVIPENITCIESGAFFRRENLTSIIIPESVTFIGHAAFIGCRRMTSIQIPKNVCQLINNRQVIYTGLADKIAASCKNLKRSFANLL